MADNQNFSKDITDSVSRIKNKLKLLMLINKAKAEFNKNNYSGCEAVCNEILNKDPKNITALRGLGCAKLAADDKVGAIDYFKKALENSDNKEIEYSLIGTVYYINNEFEDAIEYFNKAIDLNNDFDYAYDGKNQSMLESHLQIADLQEMLINNEKS